MNHDISFDCRLFLCMNKGLENCQIEHSPSAGFVLTSVIVQVALSQTQQSLLENFHDRQGFSLKQGLVKFSKNRAEERFQGVAGMSYNLPISLHYYCSYANVIYYLVQE